MVDKGEQKKRQGETEGKITFAEQGKEEDFTGKEEDIKIEIIEEDEESRGKSWEIIEKVRDEKKDKREIRIELKNVSKKFNLGFRKNETTLARLLSFFKREGKNEFLALNNINLKVYAGENLGVIGKNGSGKSTLLRVISEVYRVDKGEVKTNGQLVYLTGFGHGLQPKLTMKENIFLVGSVMGLGQQDIKKRFDDIVEFSGLRDYVNTKLFKFSTGMQTRLASSIGLHCVAHRNPDILLVDEVIGGGADKDYQEKSLKKMEGLLRGGSTVVLVSHNLDAIKKYCNRVIWIDEGKAVMEGNPEEVVESYELNKTGIQ